jgi:hypothetical protein
MHPNPTSGIFILDLSDEDVVTIEVLDLLGKVVYSSPAAQRSHDISSLAMGTYLVVLYDVNKSIQGSARVVKN